MSTILVVDDSLVTQRILGFMLNRNGFSVLGAFNGLEALEILKSSQVSVVMGDLSMPRMDGLELLKQIRSQEQLKDIPFIMLTASGEDGDLQEAKSAGVDGFLTKPSSTEEVMQAINQAINNRVCI
jgi:CheY-like chemotaxis protein